MIDPSESTQQTDREMLAVPKELALFIEEIINLYDHHNKQNVIEALRNLISAAKRDADHAWLESQPLANYSTDFEAENESDFIKSWNDIFNVQVYIDTDIFGELDTRPPVLKEVEISNIDRETIIHHNEATEIYVQAWKELAQSMSSFPDDLFTRLWTTIEIAKILECSPSSLRRSRRNGRLPIQVKNMILDCISHDGKRSLWFVRPA